MTVDSYINSFPKKIQIRLRQIRAIIIKYAPDATESIAYRMPAYKTNGKTLVYFAGFNNHIGFYATPTGHAEFAEEFSKYKHGRGSVQFLLDKPLPTKLIGQIVRFRVIENLEKSYKLK